MVLALLCPLLAQAGGFAGGTGEPNAPYQVATAKQLISIGSRSGTFDAGGLVGTNDGYIGGCCATGGVLGWDHSYNYGGLVGNSYGTILNCHSDTNIITDGSSLRLGGLVGVAEGTIINWYPTGSINTGERCSMIGGLIGDNGAYVVNSYASGRISAGADGKQVGGLVGDNVRGEVGMCFWDIDASGTEESAAGTGLNTVLMQRAGTFLEGGWDFVDERANGTTDAWRMPEGAGYPVLTLELDGYGGPDLAGTGTADAPYRIGTPQDLGAVWRHDPSAYYELTSHIDLSGIRWAGAPIAAFNGTLNGAGFVISHLTLQGQRTAGLFGTLYPNAIVMNLGLADANVMGGHHARNLGLLVGSNYGGSVTRCYTAGRLSGGRQSFALGGLIGSNQGSITDCYVTTNVSCDDRSSGVGGLLGVTSESVERSYAAGAIAVPDPNGACGGFVGVSWKATVANCYSLALSDGGGPTNFLGVPLASTQMKQQASFAGWDFKNTWMICEARGYPRLRWEKVDCGQPSQEKIVLPTSPAWREYMRVQSQHAGLASLWVWRSALARIEIVRCSTLARPRAAARSNPPEGGTPNVLLALQRVELGHGRHVDDAVGGDGRAGDGAVQADRAEDLLLPAGGQDPEIPAVRADIDFAVGDQR
jgi:hypothetical protein